MKKQYWFKQFKKSFPRFNLGTARKLFNYVWDENKKLAFVIGTAQIKGKKGLLMEVRRAGSQKKAGGTKQDTWTLTT